MPFDYLLLKVDVIEKSDPSKVKVLGPAAEGPIKAHKPTSFTLDCSKAGPGRHTSSLAVVSLESMFGGFTFAYPLFVKVCDRISDCLIISLFLESDVEISGVCVCLCMCVCVCWKLQLSISS